MNEYYVVETTEKCSNRFLNERRCGGLEYGSYYETFDCKSQFTLTELERLESQYDVNLLHNKDLALLPIDLFHVYEIGRNVTIPLPLKVGDLS